MEGERANGSMEAAIKSEEVNTLPRGSSAVEKLGLYPGTKYFVHIN